MTQKHNIFLVGSMGAGKSTIGRQLSQQLKMEFYDSDQEIEQRTGVDISWILDVEGENGFRNREKKIIDEFTKKQGIILAIGSSAIDSKKIRHYLSSRGIVVYLFTTIQQQIIRNKYDKKRVFSKIKTTELLSKFLEKLAFKYNPFYKEIADITINTNNQNIKVVTMQIIKLINYK